MDSGVPDGLIAEPKAYSTPESLVLGREILLEGDTGKLENGAATFGTALCGVEGDLVEGREGDMMESSEPAEKISSTKKQAVG